MTITAFPTRNEYTATAGQTVFTYTFKIFETTDILAFVTPVGQTADDSADAVTVLSVTGVGDESGGTVTLDAVDINSLVTLVSAIPQTRTTDYQDNGDFIPDTVNNDLDRVVSLAKQAIDKVDRGVVVQESQQGASPLIFPQPEAGKLLGWNVTEDALTNETPQGTILVDGSVTLAKLDPTIFGSTKVNNTLVQRDGSGSAALDVTGDVTGNADTATLASTVTSASQAEQEIGTATDKSVTPSVQQFHPSSAKSWIRFNGTGTIAITDSYNVTSIVDNGVGDYTVNYTDNVTNSIVVCSASSNNATAARIAVPHAFNDADFSIGILNESAVSSDAAIVTAVVYGDL